MEWVRTGTRCWRSTRKPAGSLGASSGAWARSDAVSVELLYLDDWQNWRLTLGRLTTALRMSIRPDVTLIDGESTRTNRQRLTAWSGHQLAERRP
jgi:hypothetical protein